MVYVLKETNLFQVGEQLGRSGCDVATVVGDVSYVHLPGEDLLLLQLGDEGLDHIRWAGDGAASSRVVTRYVDLGRNYALDVVVAHAWNFVT